MAFFNLLMLVIGWYSFVWLGSLFFFVALSQLKTIYDSGKEFHMFLIYFPTIEMRWMQRDTEKFRNKIEQKKN